MEEAAPNSVLVDAIFVFTTDIKSPPGTPTSNTSPFSSLTLHVSFCRHESCCPILQRSKNCLAMSDRGWVLQALKKFQRSPGRTWGKMHNVQMCLRRPAQEQALQIHALWLWQLSHVSFLPELILPTNVPHEQIRSEAHRRHTLSATASSP